MDPQSPRPKRQHPPRQFHLRVNIDADAYALLKQECYLDASGRYMGMGRAVNKCIYVVLGKKWWRQQKS